VSPRGQIDLESKQLLRHGTHGDGGYVTGVKIQGTDLACNITKETLVAVNICSSPDDSYCK
jgi:hypothetical protein